MKKAQRISTKIKILSSIVMALVFIIISSTIFLNARTEKDALIINIVGKQRMLTQKIAKNVFYLYETKSTNFTELDNAVQEFTYALNSLRNGNKLLGISASPNQLIANQFYTIDVVWNSYIQNVQQFKREMLFDNNNLHSKPIQNYVNAIYDINPTLLYEVDRLVNFYTLYAERKTNYLKYFQYGAAFILMLVFIYIFIKLREIEEHTQSFIDSVKKLTQDNEITELTPIQSVPEEGEILEISDSLNSFINKVNSAMQFSSNAITQSQHASNQLEKITEEFDQIIDNLKDNSNISEHINTSEDMIIESTEELINSTKRLEELKDKLEKLKKLTLN